MLKPGVPSAGCFRFPPSGSFPIRSFSVAAVPSEVIFQKALLTLPTQQRIAFNLHYYDELNYDEIARITGKKVGTLKTNYHYATEKIKNYIKEQTR